MFKHLELYILSLYDFLVKVDCKWGRWGAWSDCDKQCGVGSRYRLREIVKERQFGGSECIDKNNETELCQNQLCHSKGFLYRTIILYIIRML